MSKLGDMARASVMRDFAPRGDIRRIAEVGEYSGYFRFRKYLVGKLVRVLERTPNGCNCEFVNEADRRALNAAAGWQTKRKYLFDCVKFKEK